MEASINYFQCFEDYFWQWEIDPDVEELPGDEFNLLSIPHVSVIAYRGHALELLKALAEGGIPPFGSFLLVLYATGNFRFSNFDGINYYFRKVEKTHGSLANTAAVLQLLQSVVDLPAQLKTDNNKLHLLQTLFHNCHHKVAASKAQDIINYFEQNKAVARCASLKPFNKAAYARDLSTLQLLNDKFPDTASIIRAMQQVPELPEPSEEVAAQVPEATEKDFVDRLIDEPKTFEVGKLIRYIWGGLKIPMQHFSPGDQPLGGISDMTNKGNIDRILLSEFAYDEALFLQRIANNEALYIQREIPPEKNIFERVIIVDTSLRNWGTPKILALSTALAIARHPKSKDECRILLAAQTVHEVNYRTVEGIIEALLQLGPVADCSPGLHDFFSNATGSGKLEVFLLTAADSFLLPSVQKTISDNRDQFKFVICFGTNGSIDFFKMHKGTKRLVQTIQLPLNELWKKPAAKKATKSKQEATDYPILFTATPNPLAGFYLDGGYYFLTRKKILYRTYLGAEKQNNNYHYTNFRGWEPVVRNISFKAQGSFALGKNKDNELLLCQYHPGERILSVLNLQTKKYWSLKHNQREKCMVVFHEYDFYFAASDTGNYLRIVFEEGTITMHPCDISGQLIEFIESQQLQIRQSWGYSRDTLTNHTTVGITSDGHLQFSKHALTVQHTNLVMVQKRPASFIAVAARKGNEFLFEDESRVLVDEGMITLRSSNGMLPDIYIPSCIGMAIAAATQDVYCGVPYYLPQYHQFTFETVVAFYDKYIEAFIQNIIKHAASA